MVQNASSIPIFNIIITDGAFILLPVINKMANILSKREESSLLMDNNEYHLQFRQDAWSCSRLFQLGHGFFNLAMSGMTIIIGPYYFFIVSNIRVINIIIQYHNLWIGNCYEAVERLNTGAPHIICPLNAKMCWILQLRRFTTFSL